MFDGSMSIMSDLCEGLGVISSSTAFLQTEMDLGICLWVILEMLYELSRLGFYALVRPNSQEELCF